MWVLEWSDTDELIGEYEEEGEALNVVNRMVKIYGFKQCPPMMLRRRGLEKQLVVKGDDLLNRAERTVWKRDWSRDKDMDNNETGGGKERQSPRVPSHQSAFKLHGGDVSGGHDRDEDAGTISRIRAGLTYRQGPVAPRR